MPMVFKTICSGVSQDQRLHLDTFDYAIFQYDALRRNLQPGAVAVGRVQEVAVTAEMFSNLCSTKKGAIGQNNNDDEEPLAKKPKKDKHVSFNSPAATEGGVSASANQIFDQSSASTSILSKGESVASSSKPLSFADVANVGKSVANKTDFSGTSRTSKGKRGPFSALHASSYAKSDVNLKSTDPLPNSETSDV